MRVQVPSQDVWRKNASASREPLPKCLGHRRFNCCDKIGWIVGDLRPTLALRRGERHREWMWRPRACPAARYSGVFVGLMKRVASLRANGISATSHPAR